MGLDTAECLAAVVICVSALFLIGFRLVLMRDRIPNPEVLYEYNRREYLRILLLEMCMRTEIRRARNHFSTLIKMEPKGLDPDVLQHLHTFVVEEGQQLVDCSVCLYEFKVGEKGRILPDGHYFHMECVDRWFLSNRTCPNCRFEVGYPWEAPWVPTPAPCNPESSAAAEIVEAEVFEAKVVETEIVKAGIVEAEIGRQQTLRISSGVCDGADPFQKPSSVETPSSQPNLDLGPSGENFDEPGDAVAQAACPASTD